MANLRATSSYFLCSGGKPLFGPLQILLEELNATVQGSDLTLGVLKGFLFLLEPLVGVHEFLLGLIEVDLELLHLLLKIADLLLSPFGAEVGILSLLFTGISP